VPRVGPSARLLGRGPRRHWQRRVCLGPHATNVAAGGARKS
jgi:hypothetical protein